MVLDFFCLTFRFNLEDINAEDVPFKLFYPHLAPRPWTVLLVIFVLSNLTLCPQTLQQSKTISLPDNVTSVPVKNLLNIEKYLSLRDSQAIFTLLDRSRICLPNQQESPHLVNMYSTQGTELHSLRSLSYFTLQLFNYVKFTNERNGSLARLSS